MITKRVSVFVLLMRLIVVLLLSVTFPFSLEQKDLFFSFQWVQTDQGRIFSLISRFTEDPGMAQKIHIQDSLSRDTGSTPCSTISATVLDDAWLHVTIGRWPSPKIKLRGNFLLLTFSPINVKVHSLRHKIKLDLYSTSCSESIGWHGCNISKLKMIL